MISILLVFILSNAYAKFYNPIKIKDQHQYYYSIPPSDLEASCGKESGGACNCSLNVKIPSNQSWLFRRPGDEVFCKEFQTKVKKMFKRSKEIEIFGYGIPGSPQFELQYIGAIRDKKACWEWFDGDCGKFKP